MLHLFSKYFNEIHKYRCNCIISVFVAKIWSSSSCPCSRIAKNALVLSEKFGSSDQKICINYYMGAGQLESHLSCSNKLRKGFASGLSSGDANTAFFCASHGVYFSIISAEKDLTSLLKEIDYYLLLLETHKSELTKKFLLCFRETVATLIDRGETTGIDAKLSYADAYDLGPGNKLLASLYFQEVFRNYWLGYTERCHHYAQKSMSISKQENFSTSIMKFYHGKVVQACIFEQRLHQGLSNDLPLPFIISLLQVLIYLIY